MKAYKAFDKDLKCRNFQYEVGESYHHDGEVISYKDGFYACEDMNDCYTYYHIGSRICEVELSGEIQRKGNTHYASDIKIIRELSKDEIISNLNSEWAYRYCRDIEDCKEVRDRITDSYWAYCYCRDVKDRKEVSDRITDSYWAYRYCHIVKDRKEVRDRITDSYWAYCYCRDVKDRKEVRNRITEPYWVEMYKDLKEGVKK